MDDYVYRERVPLGVLNKVLIAVFSIIVVFGTLLRFY